MSAPQLLLVSPAFHGYWRSIQSAFERRGYAVTPHLYDRRTGAGKVREKLARELPDRVGLPRRANAQETERAAGSVRTARPDVLLVVKGDTLGAAFWEAAARVPRRGLWLYDELRRTAHTTESLSVFGAIASYSPLDVQALTSAGLDAVHIPLAHDRDLAPDPRTPTGEVVFVGARYPKREAILSTLHAAGLPVRAHGRDWSTHPVDRARTWRMRASRLPAGRDLAREEAYAVMAAAAVSLNIHGDQDGFTMRTFEAPGVGAVQLVDRCDVSRFYEPGREVLVFSTTEEAIALCRRAIDDPAWAARLRAAGRERTLAEHTFDHRAKDLEALWA